MRYRVSGAIGILWGGFILLNHLTGSQTIKGEGAYRSGQIIGLVFGILMFGGGLYYAIKGDGQAVRKKKPKSAFRRPSPPPEL